MKNKNVLNKSTLIEILGFILIALIFLAVMESTLPTKHISAAEDSVLIPGAQMEYGLLQFQTAEFFDRSKVLMTGVNDNNIFMWPNTQTYDVLTQIRAVSASAGATSTLSEKISYLKPINVSFIVNMHDIVKSDTIANAGIEFTDTIPAKANWTNGAPTSINAANWSLFTGAASQAGKFKNRTQVYFKTKKEKDETSSAQVISENSNNYLWYEIHYEPQSHELTVITKNLNGLKQASSTHVPLEIVSGTLSVFGKYDGNSTNQTLASVQLTQAEGYYDILPTVIKYRNSRNEEMAKDSTILTSKGVKISISGDQPINIKAPEFKGFTLKKEPRVITGGTTKYVIVNYEYKTQEVPIKFIDEDDPTNKLPDSAFIATPWKKYALTTGQLSSYLPKGYAVKTGENLSGMVEVNVSGDIKSTPIIVHLRHIKLKKYKEYTRLINYKFAEGVMGKIPKNVSQPITQYVEEDMANGHTRIQGKAQSFPALKVPVMDGYESDITDIPSEKLQDNQPLKKQVDVTFYYLTKIIIPDKFDFGTVPIGSLEYYGVRPVKLKSIAGQLGIEAGNPANKKFDVSVMVKSNITSTLFKMNDQSFGVGDSMVVYRYKKKNDDKKVILLDDKIKDSVSLQMFNATAEGALGNTSQNYTFNWALRSVPV